MLPSDVNVTFQMITVIANTNQFLHEDSILITTKSPVLKYELPVTTLTR